MKALPMQNEQAMHVIFCQQTMSDRITLRLDPENAQVYQKDLAGLPQLPGNGACSVKHDHSHL
jgi:hypothetical protein